MAHQDGREERGGEGGGGGGEGKGEGEEEERGGERRQQQQCLGRRNALRWASPSPAKIDNNNNVGGGGGGGGGGGEEGWGGGGGGILPPQPAPWPAPPATRNTCLPGLERLRQRHYNNNYNNNAVPETMPASPMSRRPERASFPLLGGEHEHQQEQQHHHHHQQTYCNSSNDNDKNNESNNNNKNNKIERGEGGGGGAHSSMALQNILQPSWDDFNFLPAQQMQAQMQMQMQAPESPRGVSPRTQVGCPLAESEVEGEGGGEGGGEGRGEGGGRGEKGYSQNVAPLLPLSFSDAEQQQQQQQQQYGLRPAQDGREAGPSPSTCLASLSGAEEPSLTQSGEHQSEHQQEQEQKHVPRLFQHSHHHHHHHQHHHHQHQHQHQHQRVPHSLFRALRARTLFAALETVCVEAARAFFLSQHDSPFDASPLPCSPPTGRFDLGQQEGEEEREAEIGALDGNNGYGGYGAYGGYGGSCYARDGACSSPAGMRGAVKRARENRLRLGDYMALVCSLLWERARKDRSGGSGACLEAVHRMGNLWAWSGVIVGAAKGHGLVGNDEDEVRWETMKEGEGGGNGGGSEEAETVEGLAAKLPPVVDEEYVWNAVMAARDLTGWLLCEDAKREVERLWAEEWVGVVEGGCGS